MVKTGNIHLEQKQYRTRVNIKQKGYNVLHEMFERERYLHAF